MPSTGDQAILQTESLTRYYALPKRWGEKQARHVHAVDDVSLMIYAGECLGLVGESGCGKTTLGRLLAHADVPTAGRVLFQGQEITGLRGPSLRRWRTQTQLIYQDPFDALDPRQTVSACVEEPLAIHGIGTRAERHERVRYMLHQVGLTPAEAFLSRRPGELSGGQRQRVAIARALIMSPQFVVADEPTSMLDSSVRASVLRLLAALRERYDLTLLYITHDLAVARLICDRIAVMYLGKIVEVGPAVEVLRQPRHPYTSMLAAAIPQLGRKLSLGRLPQADLVHQAIDPPPLCRFLPRCPLADDRCRQHEHPPLITCGNAHTVACWRVADELRRTHI